MALNPVMKAIRANELRPTRFHTERGDWMPARAWLAVPRAAWSRIRRRESEFPWIVPAAVVFLETLMRNDWHVFEFGSGYSTAWFAERAGRVISVEDDASWHRRVSSTLAATKNGAEVQLVDSADHPRVIERFPDETFDLIVVDSSGDRLACLASAAAKVKRGGFLLLDDSDRECLRRADDLLPGWCPHRFVGLKARPLTAVETTIFQRPRDENTHERAEGDGNGLKSWNPPAGRSWPRHVALTFATSAVRWPMSRRTKRLLGAVPRLHLGCAHTVLPGWVNIDLLGRVPTDAALNVTKPLPVPDGSVDAIFTEHMIEHLTYMESFALMRECARVLRVGGVLRIVVPDFERYTRSYINADAFIESVHPGLPTSLLGLASVAYGYSHRSIWDGETLITLLTRAGLTAEKKRFGESRIHPCPDTEARELGSLYVEAVKVPSQA